MAKLRGDGSLDYGLDPFTPAPRPKSQQVDPATGQPYDGGSMGGPIGITDPPFPAPAPATGGGAGFVNGDTDPTATAPIPQTRTSAEDFIRQWQQGHSASEGIGPLAEAYAAAGHGSRFMYGNTPSNNELMLNGGKYKVLNEGNGTWYTGGDDSGGGAPASAAGAATSPGAAASTGAGSSGLTDFLMKWLTSQSPNSSARSGLISRLLAKADEYGQPVSANDPTIKAQTDAYHGTVARQLDDFRTRAAARARAEGVSTGAFDAQVGNAEMGAGRAEAGYTSTLMGTELQSRRAALSNVLQQAGSQLSAEDAASIQSKIAAIDGMLGQQNADTSSKSVDNTFSLGNSGQSITKLLGLGSLDLQKLGLTNQNSQFYDKLGTDNAFSAAQLDYLYKALGLTR